MGREETEKGWEGRKEGKGGAGRKEGRRAVRRGGEMLEGGWM